MPTKGRQPSHPPGGRPQPRTRSRRPQRLSEKVAKTVGTKQLIADNATPLLKHDLHLLRARPTKHGKESSFFPSSFFQYQNRT